MDIILSDTKHVQVFMFKWLLNINQKKPKSVRMYPKVGRVPEALLRYYHSG
jgi:hypothetical protein